MDSDVTPSSAVPTPDRISAGAYVIAGVSFIPLIGVPFGLIGLVWAALSRRSGRLIVAVLSFCGLGVTAGIYGWLFYQAQNPNGPFAPLRTQLAEQLLIENVKAIELYKLQTGRYPQTLADLARQSANGGIFVPTDPSAPEDAIRDFYYERTGENGYYLRGLGPDGRPFTPDDLVPDLGPGPQGQVGLVVEPPKV